MRNSAIRPALMMTGLLALAACGEDTTRTLGFTRDAPDEFTVVTRAPLSLPPTLGDLPPPRPGAPRPQYTPPAVAAEAALAPRAPYMAEAAQPTAAESALLAQAGGPAPAGIRRQVDEESLRLEQPDRSLVDRLMFWRDTPPPGVAVDPARETARLRENAALGRDPGDGQTAIIQRKRSSFLGIF
ncbi:DUF3035 domain-containing protein [Acetobacteraceae bacterium H6797]|nr:DUF3035 domain-containing protein [Acetobacteraceae bacterium H6797]